MQVMTPIEELAVLNLESSYADARKVLDASPQEVIPVVQSMTSMVIVGAVLREDVVLALNTLDGYYQLTFATPIPLGVPGQDESPAPDVASETKTLLTHERAPPPPRRTSRSFVDPFSQKLHFVVFSVSISVLTK